MLTDEYKEGQRALARFFLEMYLQEPNCDQFFRKFRRICEQIIVSEINEILHKEDTTFDWERQLIQRPIAKKVQFETFEEEYVQYVAKHNRTIHQVPIVIRKYVQALENRVADLEAER